MKGWTIYRHCGVTRNTYCAKEFCSRIELVSNTMSPGFSRRDLYEVTRRFKVTKNRWNGFCRFVFHLNPQLKLGANGIGIFSLAFHDWAVFHHSVWFRWQVTSPSFTFIGQGWITTEWNNICLASGTLFAIQVSSYKHVTSPRLGRFRSWKWFAEYMTSPLFSLLTLGEWSHTSGYLVFKSPLSWARGEKTNIAMSRFLKPPLLC